MAELRAVVRIQAAGFDGAPAAGHRSMRHRERLLHRLLGQVEIAEEADQGGHRPSRLTPEQAVEILGRGRYRAPAASA